MKALVQRFPCGLLLPAPASPAAPRRVPCVPCVQQCQPPGGSGIPGPALTPRQAGPSPGLAVFGNGQKGLGLRTRPRGSAECAAEGRRCDKPWQAALLIPWGAVLLSDDLFSLT